MRQLTPKHFLWITDKAASSKLTNFPENNPILPLASPVTLAFRSNQPADAPLKTGGFLPCVEDAMNDGIA